MLSRRSLLGTGAGFGLLSTLAPARTADSSLLPAGVEPDATIDLWPPHGISPPSGLTEHIVERSKTTALRDRALLGVTRPRLNIFRPAKPNGAAVLILPGGGFKWVVIDKEGFEFANWLRGRGFTAYVLYYRLPGDGWEPNADIAVIDAQRAMRVIRSRHGAHPVHAVGFSAGGHVCADLASRFATNLYAPVDRLDEISARPDLAAPIYPVISMDQAIAHSGSRLRLLGASPTKQDELAHSIDRIVPADAPPHFLLHSQDDDAVPVANTMRLYEALISRGIETELHVFPTGGHGFGLRLAKGKAVEFWPELWLNFARHHAARSTNYSWQQA